MLLTHQSRPPSAAETCQLFIAGSVLQLVSHGLQQHAEHEPTIKRLLQVLVALSHQRTSAGKASSWSGVASTLGTALNINRTAPRCHAFP